MSKILRTTHHHEGQEIEIFVKYDPKEDEVEEIKSVNLKTHGHTYPIGNFCYGIDELQTAIEAIVDKTDWREIYRDTTTEQEIDNELDSVPCNMAPVIADAFNNYPIIRQIL